MIASARGVDIIEAIGSEAGKMKQAGAFAARYFRLVAPKTTTAFFVLAM